MENNTHTEKTPADLFLQNLRTSTTPMHTQLEENEISKSLMKETVSLTDYAFYLKCMGEVMKVYDDSILPAVKQVIPDTDKRTKTSDIQKDLEYLYNNGAEEKPTQTFTDFPQGETEAFALGYAYVLEGSTLGGRVILKHIQKTLGLDETQGGTFFGGYGAETGKYWKEFLQAMTTYAISKNEEEGIIRGAQYGFNAIHEHFQKNS